MDKRFLKKYYRLSSFPSTEKLKDTYSIYDNKTILCNSISVVALNNSESLDNFKIMEENMSSSVNKFYDKFEDVINGNYASEIIKTIDKKELQNSKKLGLKFYNICDTFAGYDITLGIDACLTIMNLLKAKKAIVYQYYTNCDERVIVIDGNDGKGYLLPCISR